MQQTRTMLAHIKGFFCAVLAVCVLALTPVPAMASGEGTQAVRDARNGILQVYLAYNSTEGYDYFLQGGTGFLVNDSTVVTCEHVISPTEEINALAIETWGENYKERLQIKVVVMRDMYVEASVKNASAETDFAILSLAQPIYDRQPLAIGDSDNVQQTNSVFALGFPSIVTNFGDDSINTFSSDDVTVESGSVTKLLTVNGTYMLQNNANLSEGNSGGPLVDENGYVVGVNQGVTEDGYYYAIAINQVSKALDAFGVVYETESGASVTAAGENEAQEPIADEPTPAEQPEQTEAPAVVDKNALLAAIDDAEARQEALSKYTEDSRNEFTNALNLAKGVSVNSAATQSEVDDAAEALLAAQNDLEIADEGGFPLFILILAGIVIVAVVVIVIILLASRKKEDVIPAHPPTPQFSTPTPPANPAAPQGGAAPYSPTYTAPVVPGSEETTVLNPTMGETSVLGAQQVGSLTRRANSEKIVIDRPEFIIGKNRGEVNYFIPDNSSISRRHAKITVRDGRCFITDMNTTNFTYVNGKKIAANVETPLSSGDVVKLADEEFDFSAL